MAEHRLADPLTIGANEWPTHTALESDDGRSFTFHALDRRVAQLAGRLHDHGVVKADRLGVAYRDRFEASVALLAGIRAGGIVTPIDSQVDQPAIAERIDQGELACLLTDREDIAGVEGCAVIHPEALEEAAPIDGDPIPEHRPISQLFTSGSTGEPKPIIHTAGNHAAAATGARDRLALTREDRWFDPLGLHHMGGFAPLLRGLPEGIPVVVTSTSAPSTLFEEIERTQATIASVVPTMLYRALETESSPPDALRCLLVGGAPLRESLFQRARDAGIPVWSSYGLTETLGQVATATPGERDAHPGTVGRPLPELSVRILDDDGAEVAGREPGLIEVAGPTVSASVATAETDHRWRLKTADIGHVEDGRLWIHGREDDAIHTGGETVHPHRVEETIATHAAVADVAVVGLEDPEWGERVVAAVVTQQSLEDEQLRVWCQERLPAHAVPKSVFTVDAIPRTVSGTIDRESLRVNLAQGGG